MLNISKNSVNEHIEPSKFSALNVTQNKKSGRVLIRLAITLTLVLLVVMFLPWTQNIQSQGKVIALRPDQRPQTIHSVIGGRIEKWFVQEGDLVKKGDTILYISEIKDDYFDAGLIDRTKEQMNFKESGVESYDDKLIALENQVTSLRSILKLKLEQSENNIKQAQLKVINDSLNFVSSRANFYTAEEQFTRFETLYQQGLKSLTDVENRNLSVQKTRADFIGAENNLLVSRNSLINAQVEYLSIRSQYAYEISKVESDINSVLATKFDASSNLTKLENQLQNYTKRQSFYYITAPQNGFVTKVIQNGLGEIIKEGTPVLSIMPEKYDLAVEMYVDPIDLPLIEKGQHVRIQFDGWPAIVFSGWPNSSVGTFGGEIYAIDNFISENGKYRVLVIPDKKDAPWPEPLRVGAGTSNMLLLKDVPIWYELWRKINGFPPDYYMTQDAKNEALNTKK